MRILIGLTLSLAAAGLSAQTAGPEGQKWFQGKVAYIKPDNSCNCIHDDVGPGAGLGTWFTPRLGIELDYLKVHLKSRSGSVDVPEQHGLLSGLLNLAPNGAGWYTYLRAGVGVARVASPYSLTAGTVDKLSYHGGGGVQRFFGTRGMASLEVRSVTITTAERRVEYQGLLGLGLRWGGEAAPAAAQEPATAPVAAAPEPAASPTAVSTPSTPVIAQAPAPEPVPPAPASAAQPQPPTRIVLDDATLHFANNQAVLSAKGRAAVGKVAVSLKAYAGSFELVVTGHTSSLGGRAYNLALSRRRAEAVAKVLAAEGLPADRIRSVGMGPDQPLADNGTRAGQARNRRVEINVKAAAAEVRHTEEDLQDLPVPAPLKKKPAKP